MTVEPGLTVHKKKYLISVSICKHAASLSDITAMVNVYVAGVVTTGVPSVLDVSSLSFDHVTFPVKS